MTGLDALVGRHEVASASDMERLGVRMGRMLSAGDLVVLTGPLGAGKTTLTRGIAEGLGVRGPVQSPTFVIARTHPSLTGGAPLVHVDAYRLGSARELDDLDIDVDDAVVVVEWGRGMAEGLREVWWEVEIERAAGGDAAGGADLRGDDVRGDALPDWDPEDEEAPDPRVVTITRRP
nr:tRNA (adenosine(37)-N6)-threonylcarbamoyltransferase complex ATPase subunit type 1 TsaE [Microbacterium bovistercoris]